MSRKRWQPRRLRASFPPMPSPATSDRRAASYLARLREWRRQDRTSPLHRSGSTRVSSSRVTRHPTAEWLARQITEAFPWASAPAYLVRDNDRAYGPVFKSRVRAMDIRDRPISPGSPWQNPYAERLIGSVRRECVDRVLIFGEAHLRQILSSYAAYYNKV